MATAAFAAVLTLLPTAAWASLDPALQMALGNPDGAKADPGSRQHYLIQRPEYALSYNDDFRFPNWVGWHLSRQDIGDIERGQFKPDQTLPDGFTIVTPADYNRSGYDRGHNCPSKDRTRTRKDNDSVFLMTNMTPQAHGLNAGPWEKLESYARDLAIQEKDDLFIYCGHGFTAPKHRSIGKAQVAVPDFGWKIVVVVPPGAGPAVRRITATTRVIAVRMPNINTISRKDWREYRVSVADIEQATGFRFFDALPASIAAQLKNRVDFDQSAPSRREKVEPIAGAFTISQRPRLSRW